MIHSILIIGQSNMAGRGFKEQVSPIENNNLLVMRNGRWQKMFTPVNPDRNNSGVSLVESFADLYEKDHNVEVGIIPCADGGTNLDQWAVGSLLFDHACYMAELASRTSNIVAVLWHQGESDSFGDRYLTYKEKLTVIMKAFREKLGLYDVPFIIGGLGEFLVDYFPNDNYLKVDAFLKEYAQENEMTGYVSAKGLKSNPDNLHFCAPALREFGKRYYEEFRKLENKDKVFVEKSTQDHAIRTEIEHL